MEEKNNKFTNMGHHLPEENHDDIDDMYGEEEAREMMEMEEKEFRMTGGNSSFVLDVIHENPDDENRTHSIS